MSEVAQRVQHRIEVGCAYTVVEVVGERLRSTFAASMWA